MKYRLTIYEANSKGVEKIINIIDFNSREEINAYITNNKIEPKPYKLKKKDKGYLITA
jgi:hypothetical protein